MDELNSLRKKNGETLDCNEWNKLVSVINYIIEFYNQYPTKLSEFENDINFISEENIAPVIQELVNNGTLSSILGESGADGKSAYLLALENGFVGTVAEWLASLKGLKGSDGKSAFVLAIDNGYTGTLQQWLESLKGQPGINGENGSNGIDGKSAYQSYVDTTSDDPILTEEEWIASLKGEQGENGLNGSNGQDGLNGITPHIDLTTGNWFIGETDTEVHAQGPAGSNGTNGTDGITPHIDSTTGNWFIGTTDTGVHALGPTGQNGSDATVDTSKFLQSPINNNGHDYVEIGGIKWATMNVGASSITDYGLYFQWGDTQGYTASQVGTGSGLKYFGWSDYKYHEGTPLNNGYDPDTITKYGSNDNLTILQISDDAVNAAWGGDWRMPTRDEFLNLYEHTTISWVNNYQNSGINGRLFIDRTDNSKVLFFPAAGDFWFGTTNQIGQSGFYWTSDKYSYSSACNISFNNNSFTTYDNHYKYNGFSIRGICDCSSIASKVAVTGDYNDLINKPVISGGGTVVQSNWNETDTSSPAYILNKPTIINGTNGTNGKSAFELAVDNGFVGTVELWLASLKGLDGQDGLDGSNGSDGVTPHIDSTTGNWFIGNTDTGVHAQGPAGQDGTVAGQLQADWNQTNDQSVDFIKNKPGIGVANGLATLDSNGKVPSSQLPSYVDDVIEGYYHDNKFYSTYTAPSGDDAAQSAWGEGWRMPTKDEYVALSNAVNSVWTNDYNNTGVAGLICTDKEDSSKVLFFPAAGYVNSGSVGGVGSIGYYWSSSLGTSDVFRAYLLFFNKYSTFWDDNNSRCSGYPVRPVLADGDSLRPYVEIGGVKWSTMNIGAESETDYGLYFQWGDTQGYTTSQVGSEEGQKAFSCTDYKYCDGTSSVMTKYNSTDGLTTLTLGTPTGIYTDEITAETSKIYLDLPTNCSYRWSGTAYVLIGSPQTLSDWNESNSSSPAYIANKPTIPAAQVQSDWNELDNTSKAFIANKPTIPTVPSNENASSGGTTLSVVTTGEKYTWNLKANIWSGTQAQYDALSPNYDSNTIYIITAAS